MRLTALRREILCFLAAQRLPVSLDAIADAPGICGQCDSTTVYRNLMLFKAAEIVRLVGTPGKVSYFVLNMPGEPRHFLICRRCGCITELLMPPAITESVQQLSLAHGFTAMPQDHEVHGLCASCETARAKETAPCKLKS